LDSDAPQEHLKKGWVWTWKNMTERLWLPAKSWIISRCTSSLGARCTSTL
jgi:hypothetical protein